MNVSSAEVIDSVAAEIKRYMEVQRREEGFDLSGPHESKRNYPPLRTSSTLSYGKLQDRSLKHYFTPSMIKTHIANLEAVPPGSPREKTVRRRLTKKMKQYSENNASHHDSKLSQRLSEELYSAQLEALNILHSETQNRLRRKVLQGPPVLRRSIAPKMTHGEAIRLVNRSSQILVATETVALAHDILSQRHNLSTRPQSAPMYWSSGLPGLYNSPERPKTARGRERSHKNWTSTPKHHKRPKYVWDINGHKMLNEEYEDTIEDDPSSSFSVSSSSVDNDAHGRRHKGRHRPSRPMSAVALPHNLHVSHSQRPFSAGISSSQEHFPHAAARKAVSPDSGFSIDAGTQTKHRRSPSARIRQAFISDSELGSNNDVTLRKYLVEIKTGNKLGAGTTADIYLSLHGDAAETDEIYLTNPLSTDKKHKPFRRGQVDIFEIEAEDVGKLKEIGIGHDHKEKGYSWFLDQVIVRFDKLSWTFHCKTWLSASFSKRKTFRHISLDHKSSESSDSESSDLSSTDNQLRKEKQKKFTRRKSSASSRSSTSNRSKSSSSSSNKRIRNVPPAVAVQPPTPTSSGHTLVETSSHPIALSSESSLEYSSDSTIGRTKVRKDDSFVEESEDTLSHVTSTTSDSDTLTDASENEKSVLASYPDKTAPFSVDNLFREKIESFSSSSSSSSEDSVVALKAEEIKSSPIPPSLPVITSSVSTDSIFREKSASFSSSSSSSSVLTAEDVYTESQDDVFGQEKKLEESSSSSSEDDKESKRKKRFSITTPLSIILESADYVSTPSLVKARESTTSNPSDEKLLVTEDEVKNFGKKRSSSSSSSESYSSSGESYEVKETILPRPRRLSMAESISLHGESAPKIADSFHHHQAEEVTQEIAEEEAKMTELLKISLQSDPPSRRSSSSSSKSSSSSSSSDERDVTENSKEDELKGESTFLGEKEAVQEKNDDIAKDFQTGRLATQELPTAAQVEEEGSYEIDESLQSDEEGIVQSASHPTIRGDVHSLIKEGETDKVFEVITLRPELLEKTNENGWSPLHVAATHGKLEILQWLTAKQANLKAETPTGYTAMHMAAMHGHEQCVKVLHAMGADIDARNVDDQTPLHLSCMSGHLETAKWLVDNNADLQAMDNFQRTALDLSKQYHHRDVTQFLKSCLRDLKQRDSSNSLLQSSKSSMESAPNQLSSSSSSSSEEDNFGNDQENINEDKVAEMVSHTELEEKKKLYEKQRKKMVRRRSSFLDVIRSEAQEDGEKSSSSSDSESSSSSSSN